MKHQQGFTLIELMFVIAIIGILAAIAMPQFQAYRMRAYQCEAYELVNDVRKNIIDYYAHRGIFPATNTEAGVAPAELIKGKYVDSIQVIGGSIHVQFKESMADKMERMTMILQPAVIRDNPTGPVSWFWTDRDVDIPPELQLIIYEKEVK